MADVLGALIGESLQSLGGADAGRLPEGRGGSGSWSDAKVRPRRTSSRIQTLKLPNELEIGSKFCHLAKVKLRLR
jgi:hypothetical protein